MNKPEIDWKKLEQLRSFYLSDNPSGLALDYWDNALLALYDQTFGERIRWKWNAVLSELHLLGFSPHAGTSVLDWGCGTGVATRSFLTHFPQSRLIEVFDKSTKAQDFATQNIKTQFPQVEIGSHSPDILLISHVLTELSPATKATLIQQAMKFNTIIWVEPGTKAVSHNLVSIREQLKEFFYVIAPCLHNSLCGILKETNQHWCHFHAPVPLETFQSRFWKEFSQKLHIDVRSLPVSYLVLSKAFRPLRKGARVLAGSRFYKGYAQAVFCEESGVTEKKFLERNEKPLIKTLRRGRFCHVVDNDQPLIGKR